MESKSGAKYRLFRDNKGIVRQWYKIKSSKNFADKLTQFLQFGLIIKCFIKPENYVQETSANGYITYIEQYDKKISIYVPYFRTDHIQWGIVRTGYFFEWELLEMLLKNYLKQGDIIFDIGANIGNHSLFFSLVAKAKMVYAFEPVNDTYNILTQNIKLNGLQNTVKTFDIALGSSQSKAKVDHYSIQNIGGTSIKEDAEGDIQIDKLDNYCSMEKVDFVKIDVEGFEINVIKGGLEFFHKYKPLILIEVSPENYKEVEKLLHNVGYQMTKEFSGYNYIFESKV